MLRSPAVALPLALLVASIGAVAGTLVVGHTLDNSVGFYDTVSGALLKKIDGIMSPQDISLAGNSDLAFVTSYASSSRTLTILDLKTRDVTGHVSLGPYARLAGMHVGKSGKIYVTAAEPGALLVVDPQKRTLLQSVRLSNKAPRMVAVDETEQFACLSNPGSGTVTVVDLNSSDVKREIRTYGVPLGLGLNREGTLLYAATRNTNSIAVISLPTGRLLHRWSVPGHPVRLALIPGRDQLLSTQVHTGDLALISLRDGSEVARMPIGKRVSGLALDRRFENAYVSAPASNIVVQVSLQDWKRRRVFRTYSGPGPVAVIEP